MSYTDRQQMVVLARAKSILETPWRRPVEERHWLAGLPREFAVRADQELVAAIDGVEAAVHAHEQLKALATLAAEEAAAAPTEPAPEVRSEEVESPAEVEVTDPGEPPSGEI